MSDKNNKEAYNHTNPDPIPHRFVQMMEYGENLLALDAIGRIWERQDPKYFKDSDTPGGYTWKLVSK